MSEAWEPEDVAGIMAGIFDVNAKVDWIAQNVVAIRRSIDENDEEEEEEAPEDD